MNDISITVSFIAGVVSFLSPCVLPLIPGFLAYLAGSTLEGAPAKRRVIFLTSFFFVIGFAAVFSLLGVALNTILEAVAYDVQTWLARLGGLIIILFGIYLTGLINLPFLEREFKFNIKTAFRSRYLTSFLFGSAFAAGWTPCVGAVLGSILGLDVTSHGSAFALLLSYSIGLGMPFLAVGLFTSRASDLIRRYSWGLVYVRRTFGVAVIILGILAFTQSLSLLANLEILNRWLLQ